VQNQVMVEAKVIGGQFFSFLYSFDYLSTEVNQRKTKRCNYPNSLIDNKKGDISVALYTLAPLLGGMLQSFSLVELAKIRKENINFTY
jgi:hypothetical protein